ncbi:hypothetical protein M2146_001149 [Lachnospiraceae bacterium PF1-22]
MGLKLKKLKTVEDFKKLENPKKETNFVGGYKWTVDCPLLLECKSSSKKGNTIIPVDKWFINNNNELIFSETNDYFNLEMYEGKISPASFILNAYCLERVQEV